MQHSILTIRSNGIRCCQWSETYVHLMTEKLVSFFFFLFPCLSVYCTQLCIECGSDWNKTTPTLHIELKLSEFSRTLNLKVGEMKIIFSIPDDKLAVVCHAPISKKLHTHFLFIPGLLVYTCNSSTESANED